MSYPSRSDLFSALTSSNRILVHFREDALPKINPLYSYGTPTGIYGYPLTEEVKEDLLIPIYGLAPDSIPFGWERKFVAAIFVKPTAHILDLATMTYEQYAEIIKLLNSYDLIPKMFKPHLHQLHLLGSRLAAADKNRIVTALIQQFADSGFSENVNAYNFWILTYMISEGPSNWSNILRKLGIDGVIDSSGYGLIHPSEPMQAFVFPNAVEKFEIADNQIVRSKSAVKKMDKTKKYDQVNFSGKRVRKDFSSAKLFQCDFDKSNIEGVNFSGALIHECSFYGANANKANFRGADLLHSYFDENSTFIGADLRGAINIFSDAGEHSDFTGALRNESDQNIKYHYVEDGVLNKLTEEDIEEIKSGM